ncbi:hypothetical protein FRB91_008190 [Serendipita sp. 411]|nr:hypothetical protein FRC19_006625 [Serendipita sp. 401]KAG8851212.1 hypothetical protein FRB91_008190 [Serendipita sp. 411]KAG9054288.1 hypothetical protein FS842_005582 [Serendipita sp. 407]
MKLPMHVVFGPNPGSYYVACGRNLEFKDMPVAFTDKMKEFTVVSWSWISMGPNCETWVARNAENDTFYFNTGLNTDIHSYLTGKNDRTQAQFVSFAPESGYWCVKHNLNGWNAYVSKSSEKKILEMQARVQGFDGGLKGILFGHGDSHIYMFQAGFAYNLEGDAENAEHPLHKVLEEFLNRGEGWIIEESSSLCFYDDRYFFLKFKRTGDDSMEMRWNLPEEMAARLSSLVDIAKTSTEQHAIEVEDLALANIVTTRQAGKFAIQMAQMNMRMNMTNALCQMMTR